MSNEIETRSYERNQSATFRKTSEQFGGLSNMAPGYPLIVNGIEFLTCEALYQACRFPHRPEVQKIIIEQRSPMTAKMKSKPYRNDSRPDWFYVRVKIMRWCLQIKLIQHWDKFSQLLLSTGTQPIVEDSRKDDFWGAKSQTSKVMVGKNVLGRLLMGLREDIELGERLESVVPLEIPNFLLYNEKILPVNSSKYKQLYSSELTTDHLKQSTSSSCPLFVFAGIQPPIKEEKNNKK
ncbi:MAG: NADAR family protein [Desulfobulbus sp.]|nr:NADAR family protein [Desulfobulbus sp.]